MVLALLLGRQGVRVTLLEAHDDFERDFRGDALQPAGLDVLGQMGLMERVAPLMLARHSVFPMRAGSAMVPFLDVSRLRTAYPFIAMVPQARLLAMLADEVDAMPNVCRVMGARVEGLIEDDSAHGAGWRGHRIASLAPNVRETKRSTSAVTGVRYRAADGWHAVQAQLVVGADGRFSRVRGLAGLATVRAAAPFDLLWFRLPRHADDPTGGVYLGRGDWLVLLNRGAEWQVAYSLPRGGFAALRSMGLAGLEPALAPITPWLAPRAANLTDWKQTSVLSVEISRARRWYRPGLLLIGDAAHTMSPVAGVGISIAMQDAAMAARVLGPRLRKARLATRDLAQVQREREWAVRIVQTYQGLVQRWLMAPRATPRIPWQLKLQARVQPWNDLAASVFGLGVWPVRVGQVEEPASAMGRITVSAKRVS
jgi:2-polyprenyl-6-methoxyphenol hydroxylase-like FAD-dependent oxidoreductase